jgi:hypothetical protein
VKGLLLPLPNTRSSLLYRVPGIMPTVQPDGSGLELRCASRDGSTVQDVLPPSIHPETGKPYELLGDIAQIPEIPPALLVVWQSLLEAPKKNPPNGGDTGTVREGGRNTMLTSLAGTMRRRGISAEAVEQALLIENANRCNPPLPDSEVRTIARSVARYAPEADSRACSIHVLSPADLVARPAPLDLMRGVLPQKGIAAIIGESGSGKSFFLFDLIASWCNGDRAHGRRTRYTPTFVVQAEGTLSLRVKAIEQHRGIDLADLPLRVVEQALDLRRPNAAMLHVARAPRLPSWKTH